MVKVRARREQRGRLGNTDGRFEVTDLALQGTSLRPPTVSAVAEAAKKKLPFTDLESEEYVRDSGSVWDWPS